MPAPLNHFFGDTVLRYPYDPLTGRMGFELLPAALLSRSVPRRASLRGLPFIDAMPGEDAWPASVIDSLAQFKLVGDSYPGAFAQGHTLRNSGSIDDFRYMSQIVTGSDARTRVVTTLEAATGCRVEHHVLANAGGAAFEISTTFHNGSAAPVTLEMLSSFSLSGISPFDTADSAGRLQVHRFRSAWSAEGRHEARSIEELHLERSWSGAGSFSERFGQVGSMPVRRWFPFVAVEDTVAGVVWGAQIAWAGSWQLEIFRQHDDVCLSGGLADRELGHWTRTLAPGESITSPTAIVACVQGTLDDLCDRLTSMQHAAADLQPAVESDLPIVFNEWCTTWGEPTHERVSAIASRLQGTDTRYLVIDAGWYKRDGVSWSNGHGDWQPNPRLFPQGLAATAAAIRARGLIPGLWFEMETVGQSSAAFSLVDHLLKRDGLPITVRERRFWDLNDPAAIDYLSRKVIQLLKDCGFGYLKVDYNETIGLGSDGAGSLGEGLRRQVEGIHRFFDKIRSELPELVIESCSSGGHRLEPSMLARSAMSSFSDAHELVEIPIIAANMHRLILPRQSQIWAVLHQSDSDQRLVYSLAATFLGRMCLSGEIDRLSSAQWTLVQRATSFYRRVAPIIKHGSSRRHGDIGPSWRHPQGWQAVVRISDDKQALLVVTHRFAQGSGSIEVPLPLGVVWRIEDEFAEHPGSAQLTSSGHLRIELSTEFSAHAVRLRSTAA